MPAGPRVTVCIQLSHSFRSLTFPTRPLPGPTPADSGCRRGPPTHSCSQKQACLRLSRVAHGTDPGTTRLSSGEAESSQGERRGGALLHTTSQLGQRQLHGSLGPDRLCDDCPRHVRSKESELAKLPSHLLWQTRSRRLLFHWKLFPSVLDLWFPTCESRPLWESEDLFIGVTYQISCITDIYDS